MFHATDLVPRVSGSWVLLTMKLITAGLLLLALGVVALSAHRDVEIAPADGAPAVSVAVSSGVAAVADGASVVADESSTLLTTVCVFIVVCCVFLAAARFTWRRMGSRVILAVAPRGSPSPERRPHSFAPRLSLSQLSISRT